MDCIAKHEFLFYFGIPAESVKEECLVNMRFIMRVRLPTKNIDLRLSFVLRVFEKSLQYVKRFSRYKNPDAVRQAREYPLVAFVSVW